MNHARGDVATFLQSRKVRVAAFHALEFVAPIIIQCFMTHAGGMPSAAVFR